MHSWASWYFLAAYIFSTLGAIASAAKKGPAATVIATIVYVGIALFTALVALPAGGFVW